MNDKMNEKDMIQEEKIPVDDSTLQEVSGGVFRPVYAHKCPHCGAPVPYISGICRRCKKEYGSVY